MFRKDPIVRRSQVQLLMFGIVMIGLAAYQLPTIWISRSLLPLQGTLRSADIYITRVTDRRGHESQVSELIFYLNGYAKKFYMAENIGNANSNDDYRRIVAGLRKADSVTVWIKKSEENEYQPKVFQIDQDERSTLLEFERVRMAESPMTAFLLVLGLVSIGFFLWFRYPEKVKKFFA